MGKWSVLRHTWIMNRNRRIVAAVLLLLLAGTSSTRAAVELSVVAGPRAPFNALQQWALKLGKLRSVQVRAGGSSAKNPSVKRNGQTLQIVAVIDGRNQLAVPGARFSMRQTDAIQKWIEQQKKGDKPKTEAKNRFGLTKAELEQAHGALKAVVSTETKGKSARDAIDAVARGVRLPVRYDGNLRGPLSATIMREEWKGFTAGTAIAAAVRPLELVMVPAMNQGRLELRITADSSVPEGWPVGWKSELNSKELVPKYFDSLPIEVEKTPVAELCTALEARLQTPMQYDWALLDLMEIDPAKKTTSYKSDRATYMRILKTSLFRAGVKHEIRVDERGKPFFWISPSKLPKAKR